MRRLVSLRSLTLCLFVIGVMRTVQVAAHSPVLGYANNYDFIKLSSTTGVWTVEPGVDPLVQHPAAPLRNYRSDGPRIRSFRYLSSELLLVRPAVAISEFLHVILGGPRGDFDLRTLGLTKALFLALACGWLIFLFERRAPWQGAAMAAVYAVLIADPINTLYLNTLYFETSGLLFGTLAVGFGILVSSDNERPAWQLAIFCIAMILTGWSKMQHPFLPLALVAAAALILLGRRTPKRQARRILVPALAAALITLLGGFANNRQPSMGGMVNSSQTNTWLKTFLPAVSDQREVFAELGLPERCSAYLGKGWLSEGMQPGPCPEIFSLSHGLLILTLLRHPGAILRIGPRAVALSQQFTVEYGQIEGGNWSQLSELGGRFASLSSLVGRAPLALYASLILFLLASGLLAVVLAIRGVLATSAPLVLFMNATWLATFLACIFGDGYEALARHLFLADNAFVLGLAGSVVMLASLVRSTRARRSEARGLSS